MGDNGREEEGYEDERQIESERESLKEGFMHK